MKNIKIIIIILLLSTIGFVVYKEVNKQNRVRYRTSVAEIRDIEEKLNIFGFVQPLKEIDIKSTISGVLEELYVQIGEDIKKDAPIARVKYVKDPMEYERLLTELEVAKTRLENAMDDYNRNEILYKEKLLAPAEFERISRELSILKSQYEATNSELGMLNGKYSSNISNLIKATDAGTVLELPVKVGGSVMARGTFNEGSTIARIADLHSLVFSGEVSESDVLKLQVGMNMQFTFSTADGTPMNGILSMISPKGRFRDGISHFQVTADITIPDSCRHIVRAGSSVSASVILKEKKQILAIMDRDLHFSYDSVYVEVCKSDGSLEKRFLKIGISDGMWSEIESGLDSLERYKISYTD